MAEPRPNLHPVNEEKLPASLPVPFWQRGVRFSYIAFYVLGLPLLLVSLLAISLSLTLVVWPLHSNSAMEGPEPFEAQLVSSLTALAVFAMLYVVTGLSAHRITQARQTWRPLPRRFRRWLLS